MTNLTNLLKTAQSSKQCTFCTEFTMLAYICGVRVTSTYIMSTRSLFFQSRRDYRPAEGRVEAGRRQRSARTAPGDHEPLIGGAWWGECARAFSEQTTLGRHRLPAPYKCISIFFAIKLNPSPAPTWKLYFSFPWYAVINAHIPFCLIRLSFVYFFILQYCIFSFSLLFSFFFRLHSFSLPFCNTFFRLCYKTSNYQTPNYKTPKIQNAELQNADYKTSKVTKGRITKRRKLQKVEKQKVESNKTLQKAEKKVENWGNSP
jgi:hypothetical protein